MTSAHHRTTSSDARRRRGSSQQVYGLGTRKSYRGQETAGALERHRIELAASIALALTAAVLATALV